MFVIQLAFTNNGFACNVINNQSSNLKIVFVNGIANTIDDACSSMQNLATLIGKNSYSYSYFYNTQDPNGVDQVELTWQATQSNLALSANGYYASEIAGDASKKFNYYKTLGERYKNAVNAPGSVLQVANRLVSRIKSELQTSTNKKLVLVAHSQGNFYVEAAYAMLLNEAITNGDASIVDLLQRLRIVGAASVAASTPHNRYLSHSNDLAVFVGQAAISSLTSSYTNYKPLKYNAVACVFSPCTDQESKTLASLYYVAQLPEGGNDTALHNFQAVYLNQSFFSEATGKSFSSIIVEMIKDSINELNPPVSTIKQFQINAIAFQSQVGNLTQYSTGLVLYMPTSSEYDNATVSGLGTASQPDGIVRLKDNGLSYLQTIVTQYGLTTVGDSVLRLPNTLTSTEIPAGTQYTVKIYKGTTLVATQTITLAGRVFSPSEMTAGMFSRLVPLTYAQLCPNNVATTATWYTTPSSIALDPDYTTPKGINATLFCSPTAPYTASARVEFGDNLNRRFMSTNTLVGP